MGDDRRGDPTAKRQRTRIVAGTGNDSSAETFVEELIARLDARERAVERYDVESELSRGGQGDVLRVWDRDLLRHLAMKVVRPANQEGPDSPGGHSRSLGRFLEEAQVTGQLDHPGVVPVHELGLDASGRPFFTMKLVKGKTLREVIELAHRGAAGWTITRALGVLLRVCDAMSYAHDKRVLHRDLKPSNVMVGPYGEVYVMDWGLARLLDREEQRDIRIRPDGGGPSTQIRSARHSQAGVTPGSPLITMDGDVVGTPSYMSPEQARGDLDGMGPHSDVYSLGAMLYHVLGGEAPYVPEGSNLDNYAIWYQVQAGPPRPIAELAPEAAPELVAICERAMERDVEQRIRTARELGENLRAFLEGRVVPLHKSGPLVKLEKWVRRNRTLATALGAAAVFLLVAVVGIALAESRAARVARESAAEIGVLFDERLAADLISEAREELWPVHEDSRAAMAAWSGAARSFIERCETHRVRLAELRSRAMQRPLPLPDEAETVSRERLALFEQVLERCRSELAQAIDPQREQRLLHDLPILEYETKRLASVLEDARRETERARPWRLPTSEEQEEHDRLARIASAADELEREGGLLDVVAARDELARTLRARTIESPDAASRWDEALAAIGSSRRYAGLDLAPQVGLLPLREDPRSGLWEFLVVLSGEPPEVDEGGAFRVEAETGIVLVLVPGGEVEIGATGEEELRGFVRNFDPNAQRNEGDPRPVTLAPFFLSKYELTQAQWWRLAGASPSEYWTGMTIAGQPRVGPTHPVEHVSWNDSVRTLARWGLTLPTEAQWERGGRGGTGTTNWWGAGMPPVPGSVNTAIGGDELHGTAGADGYFTHWPVDRGAANPFGLHDVVGNVWEWCFDWHAGVITPLEPPAGCCPSGVASVTGELLTVLHDSKTRRGASFYDTGIDVRIARRTKNLPDYRGSNLGIRPARPIDP